jgi:hypothetical protein
VNPVLSVRAVTESLESVVPVAIVIVPLPSAISLPTRNVPALNVTPPVNVFAPLNVRMEAPAFVNANPPSIAPLNVTTLGVVTVALDVNVPAPPNVNAPLFVTSPTVTAPPSE